MKKRSGDSSRLGDVGEMLMQKPPLGTQLDWENPLNRDLVMHLAMNEGHGDKVQDLSLNGNHGTLNNFAFPPTAASGWNPGQTGIGLNFDGANDYVTCGDKDIFDGTDGLTVSACIKATNLTGGVGYDRIITKRLTSGVDPGWIIQGNCTTGNVEAGANINGVNESAISTTVLDSDTWYIVAATWDKANLKIYINGVLENTNPTGNVMSVCTEPLRFGTSGLQATTFFKGALDQPRVMNRARSAKEVKDYARNPWQVYLQP